MESSVAQEASPLENYDDGPDIDVVDEVELPVTYTQGSQDDDGGEDILAYPTTFKPSVAQPPHHTDYQDGSSGYVPGPSDTPSQSAQADLIPDAVRNYLHSLCRFVSERMVYELHYAYETAFNRLTEKFYSKERWPDPDAVAQITEGDAVFLILYRELYYRHVYAKLQPTLEDRLASYYNYCDLFNYVLSAWKGDLEAFSRRILTVRFMAVDSGEPVDLELPNQWLWDIIDEFIYQFQSFCNFRAKVKARTDGEVTTLKDRLDVWNILNVLNVLYSLVQKSKINEQLIAGREGGDVKYVGGATAGEIGGRPLYKMLGYFSLVGLLRVHCLLGDYALALKTIENIELHRKGLFARVTACHVTTYYYVGFCYLMMRRYLDAVRAFSHILIFVSRTKQYHTKSYQFEVISKKSDQMLALLAMCVALCPTRIDENIHTSMREKHADHILRMQYKGDDGILVFEELFNFSCPKFISPVPPNYDVALNAQNDPTNHQRKVFLAEVRSQLMVPTIRSYLKLYTSLEVEKLSAFLEDPDAEACRNQLLLYKHKTRQRKWDAGTVLEGDYANTIQDLDFYLKQDMIHVSENKLVRRTADYIIRKLETVDRLLAQATKGVK
ncbi:Eukaryotic translation initiation factor 3 subunit L [Gonapodya sp. JEL0774]|nr:Eukaryotic translation initiation factor 3 subunit L [Gonapodya sp. JEL0774]